MQIFETHMHLDDGRFDPDRAQVMERMRAAGITKAINIGDDIATSEASVALADTYPDIYAAVGVHPHNAKDVDYRALERISGWLSNAKVVAIGEIGLDYHYDLSPRETQKRVFAQQLDIAKAAGANIVLHMREATQDMTDILRAYRGLRGVMHCYTGSVETAREALDMGLYIGFTGVITFNNANKLLDVVRYVPTERILTETDCPYMTPHPHRGTRNEPGYITYVVEKIAQLKEMAPEEVARAAFDNAAELFLKGKRI